jgi:prepilin-type N-terminal cleavage/methylation domain-containing protein
MKQRSRHARFDRTGAAGFTLLEVTIAIGILAVMLTLNYRILKGVISAKQVIDDRRDGIYIANSVLTRMVRELQLTVKRPILPPCESASTQNQAPSPADPPNPADPSQQGALKPVLLAESGLDGGSITFLAKEAGQFVPDGGTHAGIVQITYRVAKDPNQSSSSNGGLVLVREEIPNTKPLAKACKSVLRFPITNNLVSLRFQFYDGRKKTWSESWSGPQSSMLPEIIQFTISLRSPAGAIQSYTTSVHISSI